jgi:hypothetical protein
MSWIGFVWTGSGNYPGSATPSAPWQGQPLSVAPGVSYVIPNTKIPAEVFNYVISSLAAQDTYLWQQSLKLDGINWRTYQSWASSLVPGSGTGVTSYAVAGAPVWLAAFGVWAVPGLGTQASVNEPVNAFVSADGFAWQNAGVIAPGVSTNATPGGFFGRSSDAVVCTVASVSGGWFAQLQNFQTNTSIHSTTLSGGNIPSLGSYCWVSGTYFNSQFVFWDGGSSTNPPMFAATDTTDFAAATTWAPPSGFVINNLAYISSPAAVLLFPSGTSVVASYMRTSDGKNWATQAMPTLSAGESVVDATYDSAGNVYYFLSSTSSACRVWTSSTGLAGSWSVASTISHQGYALKANGPELLAWIKFVVGTETLYRAVQSTDGGVTWYYTSLSDTSAPTGYFALEANGSQFIYSNNGQFISSFLSGSNLSKQIL